MMRREKIFQCNDFKLCLCCVFVFGLAQDARLVITLNGIGFPRQVNC